MRRFLQTLALVALMALPWAANAQFCTPSPSSKDGSGITNVTFGVGSETVNSNVTWSSSPFYLDNRSQIGAVQAGTACEMSITFATGYTYGTIVWVDWNNDSTFSGSEVVYAGTSSSASPTTLAVSFDIPTTQDTGMRMMRICSADMYFDNYVGSISAAASADPCASYSWGVALDYTLRVLEAPSCTRPDSLTASNITSDGLTLSWVDALNSGATYSISYWKNGGDTTTVTSTTTSYTFTGLDANTGYNFAVVAVCSATDESMPLTGSFKTDCANGSCELTVYRTDNYDDSWNGCLINIMQGGELVASIDCPSGQSGSTATYPVCSGDTVTLTFTRGSYPGELGGNIMDGGGITVFNIANMGNYQTGDVLATIANPCPSCLPPTALTVLPDSNQIEFSWTSRSGASQFIVYLNDSLVDDNVTDSSYTFTDLTPNTPYTVKVQSVCSSDDSSSIASKSTRTACGEITLPYIVDFEGVENGAWFPCWDSVIHAGTDPSVNNNTVHQGSRSMYLQATSSEHYNLVVSPRIPTAGNNIYVRFWANMGSSSSGWLKAGVMTNPYDSSTFIPMVTVQGVSGWNEYEFRTDTLDASATYYVAWLGYRSTTYNERIASFDDVYISEIPSCVRITDVTLDTAESDQLTVSWVDNTNSGASYTVYYWKDGSTDTLTTSVYDTTAILSNLDASSAYKVIVVANCSGGDAEPSPVFTFRTDCGPMTVPFFDNFDSYTNGAWPPCWHRLRAYGTDPSVNAQYHHSGSQSMFQLASNDTTLFCTPSAVPLDGDNIYVRYWAFLSWASYYTETKWIKAGVMTDTADISTFIALDSVSYHNFNDVFEEREFTTANLDHDSTYWVAWMFYSTNNGYNTNRGAVDDIYISAIPNCLRVSSVTVVNTDSNSITVNWVDAANSGATYTVMVGDSVAATGVTDSSYTVTDLNANTQYTISVAVECGSENSEAVSVSARTTCGGYGIPYSEGFESNDNMPCWTVINNTGYGAGRSSSQHHSGSYSYCLYYGSQPGTLISPQLTGTENGLKVQFHYKEYSSYYDETFQVGYSTTNTNDTSFIWGAEINDASYDNWTQFDAIYPAGTKYVAIKYTSYNNYGLYVDDINFMLPPDCMPVSLLTVDTITSDGATIHWTAPDGQSNFIVRLNDSIFYTISDTFYFFNGLDARTLYNVAVATDCYGDTSDWVTISFVTGCANGECEIIVTSTSGYTYGTYYDATLHVVQNGVELASVIGATDTVSVCTGMPVSIIYEEPEYDYSYYPPTATVVDGGDDVVFNGNTSSNSTGDTLVTMANACPSCLKPANLIATLIDSNNITVSWNAVDTVLDYEISINGGAWTSATSPYMASGLNPNTAYTFSVRAICAIGDTSNGRNLTVKTSCGQMVLPLVEGFENDPQGTVPSCWTVVRTGYGNYPGISGSEHTGNNGMTMGADFNDSTTIASSLVPLPGDSIYVSFWASVNSGNTLQAGVMTDLAFDTTFIPLLTVPSNGSTYTLYEFNTSSLGTGFSYTNFYVAFRLVTGGSNHYADIDDINIRLNEGCMYPANLTVVNVSSSGADLEWHNNGTLTDFVVEYRTGSGAWDSAGATTDTTFNIIGLNAAQNYEARVGLVCGTDTLWSTVTFQTSCAILPLPYFENFTGYVNDGPLPPCWTYTSPGVRYYDGGAMWGQYTGNGSAIAVVPELSGNITKLQISFDAKLWKSGNNYDQVLIGVADASGTLLQWLDTLSHPQQSQANFINFTVYFTDYNIPTGAARVAFGRTHDGIGDHWALIDNINIVALPDCYPVANLTPHNLSDPEATSFTWVSQGYASQWQVYVDTVTVGIDSVENMPDSLFTTVTDTNYLIPIGDITGGGIYNIFVRSDCGFEYSNWVKYEFGAGTVIMNQSTVADTVTGCGFVVYDNGGPIAGYESNSSSALVIRTENAGSQLEIFGGKFGFGPSAATLTVYDGEGTSGTVLFTYNTVNGRDTLLDTILATSTTGALTLTFSAGQYNHTGYELYVRCTAGATCPKPTELQGTMTSATTADVTWVGSAMSYNFYYRLSGTTAWTMQTTATNSISLTGLITDTVYDMYVVAICSATDSSTPSVTRQLNTYYEVVIDPCDPVSDVVVSNITNNTAEVSWTSTGNEWEIELTNVSGTTTLTANTNPFTLVNLLPNMQYSVRVRTICNGTNVDPYSDWTTAVTFTTLMNAPTMYNVTVTSNNDAWGTVSGGGQYADGSSVVISATAAEGYYFDQWNDGDTNATRTIVVTGDVTYTANFAEDGTVNTYYTITVLSNNNAWGTVSGGGQYVDGSVVTLTATAAEGYHLEQWSTGETTNTISVTVTADATYTATFAANNDGIDGVEGNVMSLFPNPASTVVTISVEMEGNVTLSIVDMNGRTVYTKQGSDHSFSVDVSAMAKGAYFVRIVGEQSTAVSKLIVK